MKGRWSLCGSEVDITPRTGYFVIVAYQYRFVNYGERLDPVPDQLVLDVGMKTVPGVIDHHHPEAEAECATSLVAKYPGLVLDHLRPGGEAVAESRIITFVTHRLPDFDALASIFLAQRLLETGLMDAGMAALAAYTKLVDSASLPKTIDLSATPYAILRALFAGSKKSEAETNADRVEEGLKFMRFLHTRAAEGRDLLDDRGLLAGVDRYERGRGKVEKDYERYLQDLARARKVVLSLPLADGSGRKTVDGLIVSNPMSFLFKEWARRERDEAPLGRGFGFLMTTFGEERHILGVDPAEKINLRGLGAVLNDLERRKRAAAGRAEGWAWYEGNCPFFDYRIIDSPQDGTSLAREDIVAAVLEFGRVT
jgi:hypothetical protein